MHTVSVKCFCECMLLTIFSGDKSTKHCPAISADNIGQFISTQCYS